MNTGQMMLTLGAIMLLSFLILRVNSSQILAQGTMVDSKLGLVGLTVANTYIDFAKRQVFDKASLDASIMVVKKSDLTAPGDLGPETGEIYPAFDDLDDFNLQKYNIIITDTTVLVDKNNPSSYTPFYITSRVYYVNDDKANPNLNSVVNTRTWYKRLDVLVWATGLNDTIKSSSISSIW